MRVYDKFYFRKKSSNFWFIDHKHIDLLNLHLESDQDIRLPSEKYKNLFSLLCEYINETVYLVPKQLQDY